jgi:S-adenosylmethionine:tRNA ribosyltransferase-isomerase
VIDDTAAVIGGGAAIELAGGFHRRSEPRLIGVRDPTRRDSPEQVGGADDVSGSGEPVGDGADVVGHPKDRRDQHQRRPAAGRRQPHVDSHLAVRQSHSFGTARAHVADRSLRLVRIEDLDYELDPALIAQEPIEPRDAARLLVDRGGADPEHRQVSDLPDVLSPGDLVVVNDTRVIPARLRLRRATGGRSEVLLLEPRDACRRVWEALVRPARKLPPGTILYDASGEAVVEVGARTAAGDTFVVTVLGDGDVLARLNAHGEMPLPPYIHRALADPERYQTVFADEPASAAAPTAGLHLTDEVFAGLAARDIGWVTVELVVGLDTFAPITEADPLTHRMHSERYRVPAETWAAVADARRVVAVGTTTVRALESAAASGQLAGRTELFLHPGGREPNVVDLLMTNFHLPRTTLLLMIEAFVGPRWRRLYALAAASGYRFLSFGDAMLLDRHAP